MRRLLAIALAATGCWGAIVATAGAEDDLGHYFNDQVGAWGADGSGQLGFGTTTGPQLCGYSLSACSATPVVVRGLRNVSAVAAGGEGGSDEYGLALMRNGRVESWGADGVGQLGDYTTAGSDGATSVCGANPIAGCRRRLQDVTAIAAGDGQALALLESGTVVAWGANGSGQLGDGSIANSDGPVPVCAIGETSSPCARHLEDVAAIAAGSGYSMALLRNGTVVAWGEGKGGQLGDGTTANSDVPVVVTGLLGVKAIAAGGLAPMALLEDGTVMEWGRVYEGFERKEGRGFEAGDSELPIPVEGLTGVRAIAAGTDFRLALLENGTVESWGNNGTDQLGVRGEECFFGGYFCRNEPALIPDLTDVQAISAGGGGGLAMLQDGAVVAWGASGSGQAGDGIYGWGPPPSEGCGPGCVVPPAQVCGFSEARGIASGGAFNLAYGVVGSGSPCPTEPWLLRITPEEGLPGTTITISGDNFHKVRSVTFDNEVKAKFRVDSSHSITAVVPTIAGSPPLAYVSVVTAAGPSRYIPRADEPGTNVFWLREPR